MKRVEGTAGLVAVDKKDPERLVVARIGSPVVIGLGEGGSFVASDALALRPYTDRMVVLDDGEVAEITLRGIKTVDLEQRSREKRIEKILHQAEDADLRRLRALHAQGNPRAAGGAGSFDARAPGRGGRARRVWVACSSTSSGCSTFGRWCFLPAAPACTAPRSART